MENSKSHVIVLASPGMGHLIPLLELSKRLVNLSSTLQVTLFIVSTSLPKLLKFHDNLHIVELTPPNLSDLASVDASVETRISIIMRESIKALRSHITAMKSPPAALFVDIFGVDALKVADEFGISKYVFVTCNAWFLALTVYLPTLDKEIDGEYVDLKDPIRIPDCKPLQPEDVVDPMLDRKDEGYKVYLNIGKQLANVNGVLLNTWQDLEPRTLAALPKIMKPRVYPIGPVVKEAEPEMKVEECMMKWLERQPGESVLFISLGSGGTLSHEQMTELALGLELSQQRFIWVVRPPTKSDASGTFFSSAEAEPSEYLPDGFLNRVHEKGMVIRNWAPQKAILAHGSTGGFLSHCGWNSTLESVTNGVPMIAWPLYAEQKMNATMLVEELEVAIRPEMRPWKGVVSREEIEKVVRLVMVDGSKRKMMKEKVEGIKRDAEKAITGSSHNSLMKAVHDFQSSGLVRSSTV